MRDQATGWHAFGRQRVTRKGIEWTAHRQGHSTVCRCHIASPPAPGHLYERPRPMYGAVPERNHACSPCPYTDSQTMPFCTTRHHRRHRASALLTRPFLMPNSMRVVTWLHGLASCALCVRRIFFTVLENPTKRFENRYPRQKGQNSMCELDPETGRTAMHELMAGA